MPAWVLLLTFHGVVNQYGLHNLAPLIMLQAKLSSKLYYLNIFPKIVKYLLTVKIYETYHDLPAIYNTLLSPSQYGLLLPEESIYQESGYWRLPGRNLQYREESLYSYTFADEEVHDII